MNKKLFVLLPLLMVLSVALVPAHADSDDDEEDGVWCYTPDLTELTFFPIGDYAGDKAFASTVETGDWTGTFTGVSKDYGTIVFHPSGPTLFIGTVTFDSVEVDGASGGLEMDVVGDRHDPSSDWDGTWRITGGTGELEALQGHGDWWGPGWQGDPAACGVIYYSVDDIDFDDDDDDD